MQPSKGAVAVEGVLAFSVFFLILFSALEMFTVLYVSSIGQFVIYNVAYSASVGGYCNSGGIAMGPNGTCNGTFTNLSSKTREALIPVIQDQLRRYSLGRLANKVGTTDGVQVLINGDNSPVANYLNDDTVKFDLVFPRANLLGFFDTEVKVSTMTRIER